MSRLLVESGEALYGSRWQSDMARDLGVSDRTVRRWVAGDKIPVGVYKDLIFMANKRTLLINDLLESLAKAVKDYP